MFAQPQRVHRAVDQNGQIMAGRLPVGGINTRDPLARMPPDDAIDLINLLVDHFGLSSRGGYEWWAYNLPGNAKVPTLMSYYPATSGPSGVRRLQSNVYSLPDVVPLADITVSGQLFACTNLAIFDITAGGGGPWTAQTGVGGVSSDYWTWLNFQNAGGNFLLACNNEGAYVSYGGAAFSDGFSNGFSTATSGFTRVTEGVSAGQINGINPDLFVYLMVWKRRVWFIEKESSRAWYLPVEQITGTATQFDFGPHFRHGGRLVALVNWTLDGGEGIDDYLVAVSSEGDIVIFKGYDPDSADTDPNAFQLHGIWYVGALPLGYRTVDPYGGDVYILSLQGVTALSELVSGSGGPTADQHSSFIGDVSSKINPIITVYMRESSRNLGWELKFLPTVDMMAIHSPQVVIREGVNIFARKLEQGAWSRLADLPIATLMSHDALVFGGGDPVALSTAGGKVYLMFENTIDDVPPNSSLGAPRGINLRVIPAYSDFGAPGMLKSFPMVRPSILVEAKPSLGVKILIDYQNPAYVSVPTLPQVIASFWDVDLWNVGLWGGTPTPVRKWLGTIGAGFAGTVQMDFVGLGRFRLTNIDFWVKAGGPL